LAGIARAIVITAGVADITTAVVGGGVSRAWPLLEPLIQSALAADPPVSGHPVRLVRAALASDAVPVGAAARVRGELATKSAATTV
ncbi:ROK family protein, partial [Streptomyces sp900105755]